MLVDVVVVVDVVDDVVVVVAAPMRPVTSSVQMPVGYQSTPLTSKDVFIVDENCPL